MYQRIQTLIKHVCLFNFPGELFSTRAKRKLQQPVDTLQPLVTTSRYKDAFAWLATAC